MALGHVVTAKRIKYWDDGVTPGETTTSQYHATYAYEVSGKHYQYKYLERAVLVGAAATYLLGVK